MALFGCSSDEQADGISVGLVSLASAADRLLVSLFFSARLMGIYIIALAFAQVQGIFCEALAPLFFPRLARLKNLSSIDRNWLAGRLRQTLLINGLVALVVVAAAPALLPLLFGEAFADSVFLVMVLVPGFAVRAMMRPYEEVLKGAGHSPKQSLAIGTMSLVFGIIAVPSAILDSITGVAAATIFAGFVGMGMVVRSVSRLMNIGLADLLLVRPYDAVALAREVGRGRGAN